VVVAPAAASPAAATPTAAPTPTPGYDYLVNDVYMDHTTVPFLTGYIAIVNSQEIPIGGVKAVGVFEPGGQRHESPLSQWFFDVATAPGAVAKAGSVKFEPGGIQAGTWYIHLEDEGGARLSEDVGINTDPEVPQWFYIKFRQPGPAAVAVASAPTPPSPSPSGATAATPAAPANTADTGSCPATMTVAGWSFVNTRCSYPDQGGVTLYGELVNNNRTSQYVFYLIAKLLDDDGESLDGIRATPEDWPIDSVPPGGRVPVKLSSEENVDVAEFKLTVSAQATGRTPRQDFEFSDLDALGGARDYCVTGELQNSGGELEDLLVVVAVLYDEAGNVINFDSYREPSPQTVIGEQTLDFEVCQLSATGPRGANAARVLSDADDALTRFAADQYACIKQLETLSNPANEQAEPRILGSAFPFVGP
jgi:hypothetical protein